MTISKKKLDKTIDLCRKYLKEMCPTHIFKEFYKQCDNLAESLKSDNNSDKINQDCFCDLIFVYVHCEMSNETIYKAIELLGIKIE